MPQNGEARNAPECRNLAGRASLPGRPDGRPDVCTFVTTEPCSSDHLETTQADTVLSGQGFELRFWSKPEGSNQAESWG